MPCPYCRAAVESEALTCPSCRRALVPAKVGPGTIVASRYRLLEELGAGGMGIVFKAHDQTLDATVALKLLRSDAGLGTLRSRFISEIKLARSIRHRNVCAIHDGGEDGDLLYISMELVDGRDLKHVLGEKGPFLWEDGYDVAVQVAQGLEAIHEARVIHRDLKPANMLMDSKGVVRVMDFGIAKAWNAEVGTDHTKTGHIVGSPEYMSPEQIRGLTLDFRSDLYSFGVVVFEIFTGRVPFPGDTPVEVMHRHLTEPPPLEGARSLPAGLVPILERALAKDRDDRYGSATGMRQELEAASKALRRGRTDEHGEALREEIRPRPEVARLLIPQLLRALVLPDPIVRRDAAVALGTIGAEAVVRLPLEKTRDEDDDLRVRDAAVQALRRLPPAPPPPPPSPSPAIPPPEAPPKALSSGDFETEAGKGPPPPPAQPPAPRPQRPLPVPARKPPAPLLSPPRRPRRLVARLSIATALASLLVLALVWLVHDRPAAPRVASPVPTDTPSLTPESPFPSPEGPPSPSPSAPAVSVATAAAGDPTPPRVRKPALAALAQGTAAAGPAEALPVLPTTTTTTTLEVVAPTDPQPREPTATAPIPSTTTPPPLRTEPEVVPPHPLAPLAAIPTPMLEVLALHGTVEMQVLVDEKGRVADQRTGRVEVLRKGDTPAQDFAPRETKEFERVLAEAARKSTSAWRFAPATRAGTPVREWFGVRVKF